MNELKGFEPVAFAVTNFDGRVLQLSVTQDPFYSHSTPLYKLPEEKP